MPNPLLNAISEWKHDASEEELHAIYYSTAAASRIESGSATFAIGRKGTGKTAIAKYIATQASRTTHCATLSFKNFPLEVMTSNPDEQASSRNRFASAWEFAIYCAVLTCMRDNMGLPEIRRKAISAAIGDGSLANLAPTIRSWGGNFNIPALFGAGVSPSSSPQRQLSWADKLSAAQRGIEENSVSDDAYRVLIDDLDEDYAFFEDRGKLYNETVAGLFRGCLAARKFFQSKNLSIKVSAFMRDDIFASIRDGQRNSWSDHIAELKWDNDTLRRAIAHRIDPEAATADDSNPMEIFRQVLNVEELVKGKRSPFAQMAHLTQMRIRDYVMFMKHAATQAIAADKDVIDVECLNLALDGYSSYLRREIEDEMLAIEPKINERLRIFSIMDKGNFRFADFKSAATKYYDEARDDVNAWEFVDRLFRFGVIGNVMNNKDPVYYFNDPNARLARSEPLCVHPGLRRGLLMS